MSGTRSRFLLTAAAAFAITLGGCAQKRTLQPEISVPIPADNAAQADAPDQGTGLAGGPVRDGWGPGGDTPPALDPTGGFNSSVAETDFMLDEGTGGIVQDADLSGVESAVEIADLDMVHFPYDQSGIKPEWQKVLDEHAEWLRSNPEVHVQVEGHCDERGTEEYNVALGQRRADSVREYLVGQGVDGYRISTISYGKLRPLTFDQNEEAHSLNRRAMFLVYTPGDQGTETAAAY